MSQIDRIGKARFSRRQVTKRTFNIGSSFEKNPNSAKKDQMVVTPQKEKCPVKNVHDAVVTPPGPQNISSFGEVSVSFITSTPKPGKPQMTRKRPLSAVQESKIYKTNKRLEISESKKIASTRKQEEISKPQKTASSTLPTNQQQQNVSVASNNRSKTRNGSSTLSSSQSNLSKSGHEDSVPKSSVTKGKKVTKTSTPLHSDYSVSTSKEKEEDFNKTSQQKQRKQKETNSREKNSQRRKKKEIETDPTDIAPQRRLRKQIETDPTEITPQKRMRKQIETDPTEITPQKRKRRQIETDLEDDVYDFDDASVDNDSMRSPLKDRLDKKSFFTSTGTSEVLSTAAKKRSKISETITSVSVSGLVRKSDSVLMKTQNQRHNDGLETRVSEGEEADISIRNKENCPVKRSKAVNKKQTSTRPADEVEEEAPVRKVMILQDGRNRKRTDMMDLDVALTALTEAIESQVAVCETQKEQSAIRLLEKYLVQDISRTISDMQNVKKLQDKIRKSTQSVKERQKRLMSLQREKADLLIEKGDIEDKKQSANNMKGINSFLSGMKQLISQL